MNQYIAMLAGELAKRINKIIDLPFVNEEEEEVFFRLVVTKVLEIAFGQVYDLLNKDSEA
jgi:hypothetical protein